MMISGWGRYPSPLEADAFTLYDESLLPRFLAAPSGGCIARGRGRGIGDAAMAERVVLTHPFSCLLDFDEEEAVLACESGVTFGEIVEPFLPRGWCPAVIPDSGLVTVGGAIACDLHGANHHMAGCFSEHVLDLTLMDGDGRVHVCSREENAGLFHATCGGMGLTGVILFARFRLVRVDSAMMEEKVGLAANLGELLSAFLEYEDWPYLGAWIDGVPQKNRPFRAVFAAGRHSETGGYDLPPVTSPADFPALPFSLVNRATLRLTGHFFVRSRCHRSGGRTPDFRRFFFPLDRLAGWNRVYGRRGFIRQQMAFPAAAAESGIAQSLDLLRSRGVCAGLAWLSRLGMANGNYLSFPMEGFCLSLDFVHTTGIFSLIEELGRIVSDHGGRLALAADATMTPAMLREGYPELDRFQQIRADNRLSRVFRSGLSQRLGI